MQETLAEFAKMTESRQTRQEQRGRVALTISISSLCIIGNSIQMAAGIHFKLSG